MSAKRILHVVGGMNRGGTETWLMHVLRTMDAGRFHMDFLVHTTQEADFDQELLSLGSKILRCPFTRRPVTYAREFRRAVGGSGPYDIIHSHVHHFSGYILKLAAKQGIAGRIAHCHTDRENFAPSRKNLSVRNFYLRLMKHWIRLYATHGLACSNQAAAVLYGADWQQDPRFQVLYCGIDVAAFAVRPDRRQLRAELGLPPDAFVLGHVGRFDPAKNHSLLVDIAHAVMQRDEQAILLFVGDGTMRAAVERKVDVLGIRNRVKFLGNRGDVANLMMGAMDIFIFPSQYEGLGLAYVEAQAAGLPCVVSLGVPEEADILHPMIQRLSLDKSPDDWADAVLQQRSRALPASVCRANVEASHFNIRESVTRLEQVYGDESASKNHDVPV